MEATLGDERILYCQECKGMMVTMGSFLELVDVLRTQISPGTVLAQTPDPEELRRRIDCPVCRKTMDTHTYGGPGNVVMDSCETCLMNWLDHGEMRRIAAAANLEGSSGYGPRAIGGGMHPMPSMGVSVALGQSGTFGSTGMGPGAFSTIANSRMDEWTLIENQRRRREVNNFLTDLMASIFGR
jgi:Zn-finger nucleic acid-binding protein